MQYDTFKKALDVWQSFDRADSDAVVIHAIYDALREEYSAGYEDGLRDECDAWLADEGTVYTGEAQDLFENIEPTPTPFMASLRAEEASEAPHRDVPLWHAVHAFLMDYGWNEDAVAGADEFMDRWLSADHIADFPSTPMSDEEWDAIVAALDAPTDEDVFLTAEDFREDRRS